MKKITLIFCGLFLLFSFHTDAAFTISPATQQDLINILKGLAEDHSYKQWCDSQCGQIHELTLSGQIADGRLNLDVRGNIVGHDQGVLPLFGSAPAVEIETLTHNGVEVPLVFFNKSYYTLLSPGSFHLKGVVRIDKNAATNFVLPGAVGEVTLDISDQEPLLKSVRSGQIGGSFQIVSAGQKQLEAKSKQKRDLRINMTKEFTIARDKTFRYDIDVVGAHAGQVISIPLIYGEKVLSTEPQNAKVSAEKVDFTATGSESYFRVEGEWTRDVIELTAAAGTVKEIWRVSCEGAYDCLFSGDVEKSVVATGHEWMPVSGQKLAVNWTELGLLKGQSIVAQEALLETQYTGKGLKQMLSLRLKSSAADQVYVDLPQDAIPTNLTYGGFKSPILKNDKGLVHLTISQGESDIKLDWEMASRESIRVPVPDIHLPVGRWVFWVKPNKNENAVFAGGLKGSPVVLFWPRMGFCLLMGLIFLFSERRLLKEKKTNIFLFLVLCCGFALGSPEMLLFVLGYIAVVRLIDRIRDQRTILGWMFEGAVLLGLMIAVMTSYFEILHKAFFTGSPFHYEDFCSSIGVLGQSKPWEYLCWEATMVPSVRHMSLPYMIAVPTLAVRVVYFIWAIVSGVYFYVELKNLWQGLKKYYALGMKPIFRRRVGSGPRA